MKLSFENRLNYFFFPYYGSFVYPNYSFLGYNLSKYPSSSLFNALEKTQLRAIFGNKLGVSFHQFFKKYRGLDIEFSQELSRRDLGINAREVKRETYLTFHKYLHEESQSFPFHTFTEPIQEYYLKVGSKSRRNEVDTHKASPEFLKHALNQDSLLS